MRYDFLVETYATERIKVVSVWSEFRDGEMEVRPRAGDARGRSVREQMIHQCVSEDLWFRTMLGINVGAAAAEGRDARRIHPALRGGQQQAAGHAESARRGLVGKRNDLF
jgi:hypothetical protein